MLINLFNCSFRIRFNELDYDGCKVYKDNYLSCQHIVPKLKKLNQRSVRSDINNGNDVFILEDTGKITERKEPYTAEEVTVIKNLWTYLRTIDAESRNSEDRFDLYLIESLSRALGIGHLFYKSLNLVEFTEEYFIDNSSWWSQDTPIETDLPNFLLYDTNSSHCVKSLFSLITPGSIVLYESNIYEVVKILLTDARLVLKCKENRVLEIADLITGKWLVPFLPVYKMEKSGWTYLYPEDIAIVTLSDLEKLHDTDPKYFKIKDNLSLIVKSYEIYRSRLSIKLTGKPNKEGFLLSDEVYKGLLDHSSRLFKVIERYLVDEEIEHSFNELVSYLVLLKNPNYLNQSGVLFLDIPDFSLDPDGDIEILEVSELNLSEYITNLR